MDTALDFVLFLIAVIFFVLTTFNVAIRQINVLALALVFFALPFLIAAWPGH